MALISVEALRNKLRALREEIERVVSDLRSIEGDIDGQALRQFDDQIEWYAMARNEATQLETKLVKKRACVDNKQLTVDYSQLLDSLDRWLNRQMEIHGVVRQRFLASDQKFVAALIETCGADVIERGVSDYRQASKTYSELTGQTFVEYLDGEFRAQYRQYLYYYCLFAFRHYLQIRRDMAGEMVVFVSDVYNVFLLKSYFKRKFAHKSGSQARRETLMSEWYRERANDDSNERYCLNYMLATIERSGDESGLDARAWMTFRDLRRTQLFRVANQRQKSISEHNFREDWLAKVRSRVDELSAARFEYCKYTGRGPTVYKAGAYVRRKKAKKEKKKLKVEMVDESREERRSECGSDVSEHRWTSMPTFEMFSNSSTDPESRGVGSSSCAAETKIKGEDMERETESDSTVDDEDSDTELKEKAARLEREMMSDESDCDLGDEIDVNFQNVYDLFEHSGVQFKTEDSLQVKDEAYGSDVSDGD